jgi:hypothetical protein
MRVLLKCAAAIWLFATPANADFKDVVAARFSSRAENVIVNVPPRPGAWPGAVLTYNMRFPAKSGDPGDPALRRGDKTSIPAEDGFRLDAKSKASVWSFFRLSPAAGDSAEIVMSFTDAQAIDMNAQDLVRRVEAAEAAAAAARRGQIPLVIRRAYVGTPIITISRKADASAEAWTKVKAGLEAAARSAAAPAGEVITYAAGEPFAFAFEADEISFDPGELAKGSIKVSFAPLPGQLFAIREQESDRALAAAESAISAITGLSAHEIEQKWIFVDPAKPVPPALAASPATEAAPVAVVPAPAAQPAPPPAPAAIVPAPPPRPAASSAATPAQDAAAQQPTAHRPPPRRERARKAKPKRHRRAH